LIARKNQIQTALVLGVLLLAFGVFIQIQFWNQIPLWYHLIFLALLVPMTWLGAKMRAA
jgi:multisubunit Na+/H+ antiporter MnhG subunit